MAYNSEITLLVAKAVKILGSQELLAKACGCSQQTISAVLTGERRLKAELAHRIDRATDGQVPKRELCPEIFDG
jgi:DNA-binding transcriptional regulator YdaS (Cro superfamily)